MDPPTNFSPRKVFIDEFSRNNPISDVLKRENFQQLQELTTSDNHVMPLVNIPASLQYLKTGEMYNCPFDDVLPEGLQKLVTGGYYNQVINQLPTSLTHLTLSENFTQKILRLPGSLRSLMLRSVLFNYDLKDVLPPSLRYLYLSDSYNHPLDLSKLPNLQTLSLGSGFTQRIDFVPRSLELLFLPRGYSHSTTHLEHPGLSIRKTRP
eukprot:TRINITY_DN2436_c0_g2_i5.p1 TRINITY_DN2436_c0_g2~~TRINITY_DN2436_c0_g2_i5.p1  ORF type:complete len:208 (-),score=13.75 TRINITY_DN2436_c0_g2_i5:294-917(-)